MRKWGWLAVVLETHPTGQGKQVGVQLNSLYQQIGRGPGVRW
jgi:hypothetical protein